MWNIFVNKLRVGYNHWVMDVKEKDLKKERKI